MAQENKAPSTFQCCTKLVSIACEGSTHGRPVSFFLHTAASFLFCPFIFVCLENNSWTMQGVPLSDFENRHCLAPSPCACLQSFRCLSYSQQRHLLLLLLGAHSLPHLLRARRALHVLALARALVRPVALLQAFLAAHVLRTRLTATIKGHTLT